VKLLSSKRRFFLGVALLLLALFLVRPGGTHLKARIAGSISTALGRRVDIDAAHLRILPQPGFDLENFVVHDDPLFGAEPVLRSQEVTAALRLSSLLRGHLEISRLSLTDPSFNLVRNAQGHWNIENLLERTAKTTVAPTGKTRVEPRPGFPYIEASAARINFKFGQEKKPYALMDANFALWQDSENTWGVRLKARPMRIDFNLSDTGLLTVSGVWQRAATLRDTPLQFSFKWDRPQLGQMTKLLSGKDRGWRGGVTASAVLEGTPSDLSIRTEASLQDFRRYDIMGGQELRLAARCEAHYSSADRTFRRILCDAPVGDGAILLRGQVAGLLAPHNYDLVLSVEQVPIQAVMTLARHAKKDLPEDLLASGNLDAKFTVHASGEVKRSVAVSGRGEASNFHLQSISTNTLLDLGSVAFRIPEQESGEANRNKNEQDRSSKFERAPEGLHLELGPSPVALGRTLPATLRGWISKSGYSLSLQGDAQVKRLLQLARTLGLPASQAAAEGLAKLNLQIAGGWSGFAAPEITGTAQLNTIRVELRGLNAPLEISAGDVVLDKEELRLQNLDASLADGQWAGSLHLPRHCVSPQTCPIEFDLHADQIVADEWNELLSLHPRKRPWYRLLSGNVQPGLSVLAAAHASGKLTASRLMIKRLVGEHVSANVELNEGKVTISNLQAEVLSGKHNGKWQADFTVTPPAYSGTGTLERVSLAQVATLMRDGWITGVATTSYHVTLSDYSSGDLLESAKGALYLDIQDGTFPHVLFTNGSTPLHVSRFRGHVVLQDGKFEIQQGKLETPTGIYQVSGIASPGRDLDIRLLHDPSHGFSIRGTVAEPRVSVISRPETRAALKP
jgi:hypothetical protein